MTKLFGYLLAPVRGHLDKSRDDLTAYLIKTEFHGQKPDPSHLLATMALLLIPSFGSPSKSDSSGSVSSPSKTHQP
jgi:hypothetical protein